MFLEGDLVGIIRLGPSDSSNPYSDAQYNAAAAQMLQLAYYKDEAYNVSQRVKPPEFPLTVALARYMKRDIEYLMPDAREYAKACEMSDKDLMNLAEQFLAAIYAESQPYIKRPFCGAFLPQQGKPIQHAYGRCEYDGGCAQHT